MALDAGFEADCPYGPGGVLIDQIVEVDAGRSRVVARFPTSPDLPLIRAQRTHPVLHPPHVAAGLMIHLTGIMGYAHAYFIEGLRHADGWVGYGVRIHRARFHKIAGVESPLFCEVQGLSTRRIGHRCFGRYHFEFRQEGHRIYDGDQSALWLKLETDAPASTKEL